MTNYSRLIHRGGLNGLLSQRQIDLIKRNLTNNDELLALEIVLDPNPTEISQGDPIDVNILRFNVMQRNIIQQVINIPIDY